MRPDRSFWIVSGLTAAIGVSWLWLLRTVDAPGQWPGLDEAIIGQLAQRAGRPEAEPLLSWVQGDLLLCMFLCAGLLAGFVLGYCARVAFVEQREPALRRGDELGGRAR